MQCRLLFREWIALRTMPRSFRIRPFRSALAAAALAAAPLPAQHAMTPAMQQSVDALARALREKNFDLVAPYVADSYHVDDVTGPFARQALQQFVAAGLRAPTAVQVDSVRAEGENVRVVAEFAFAEGKRSVALVLTPDARFVEVPLFHVRRIPGMTIPGGAAALGGAAIDTALRAELVRMAGMDQQFRGPAPGAIPGAAEMERQQEADRRNLARLEEIIAQRGWPGAGLVAEDGAQAAFLVLQHAPVEAQERYLPQVRQAAAAGQLPTGMAAMLEDRVLMQRGRNQLYGTQLRVDPATRALSLWPVDDEAHVDERRARVGLNPLADYLRGFGIEYHPPKP